MTAVQRRNLHLISLALVAAAWWSLGPVATSLVVLAGAVVLHPVLSSHADEERIQHELTCAYELQTAGQVEWLAGQSFEIQGRTRPCHELNGDFFDLIEHSKGVTILVGDVAGKGIPAALYQACCRTLLNAAVSGQESPEQVLSSANQRLHGRDYRGLFTTALCAELDSRSGRLELSTAGHAPPLLWRAGRVYELLCPAALPLGLSDEACFHEVEIHLQPGDRVIFYTDGLTEARNLEREFFGEERLAQALRRHAGLGAGELAERLLAEVEAYAPRRRDDLTVVVLAFG